MATRRHSTAPPSALGAALFAVIGVLWRIVSQRANDCEQKPEKTQRDLLVVTDEVGELKGRVQITEQIIRPKLDQILAAIERKGR
jgi:hypothetical protein